MGRKEFCAGFEYDQEAGVGSAWGSAKAQSGGSIRRTFLRLALAQWEEAGHVTSLRPQGQLSQCPAARGGIP